MFTPFGKELRKLRIERGEILKNMADKLEVTSSFLSAVETGKKSIPRNWTLKLGEIYNLSMQEKSTLQRLAEDSAKVLKINLQKAPDYQRNVALVFARKFQDMNAGTAQQVINLLNRSDGKEVK